MTFPKEFKEAISHLPSSEKDKLILRLLKHDLLLANRLLFELVDARSVEDRREAMGKHVLSRVKRMTETFYSIGYLNMDVRYLSGDITEHVRVTKDKYGEVSLNILLLKEVIKWNQDHILNSKPPIKRRKFAVALIARVFKVLLLIKKMDADLLLEFKKDLFELGDLIGENDFLMNTSISNGLDVNWLLRAEIPDDIVQIHKEIKNNGFLK